MKKVLLGFIVFGAIMVLNTTNSFAQYEKGDKLLNVGIGLRSYFIPLQASLEIGVTDEISVGPLVGFANWSDFSGNVLYIGARGSYHVNKLLNVNNDKLDLYGGAGLYYQRWSYDGGYLGTYGNGINFLAFVGGRYYFQNNLGVFAELGGGIASLNAGITLKF